MGQGVARKNDHEGMGLIFDAFGALLYNLFAKWVGGIEVHVQAAPAFPAFL